MDMSQKSDMTKMRRADRAISREDALAVIDRCAYGTLSLIATDGTPYAVALNVVRDGEKLTEMLKKSGFDRVEVFGDLSFDAPKPEEQRIIFAAHITNSQNGVFKDDIAP